MVTPIGMQGDSDCHARDMVTQSGNVAQIAVVYLSNNVTVVLRAQKGGVEITPFEICEGGVPRT